MKLLCAIVLIAIFCSSLTLEDSKQVEEHCWEKEEFIIEKNCHACSDVESSTYNLCSVTGHIENIKCVPSNLATVRSCTRDDVIFWRFEASMIVVSLVAGVVVVLRMRKLDRDNVDRIQRQISSL